MRRVWVSVIAVIAVGLPASAQATTVSQKAYDLLTREYRAQIAFTDAQMNHNLRSTETRLTSCASSLAALFSTNLTAAGAFTDELEAQYYADVAAGIDRPALTAFTGLTHLRFTAKYHRQAVSAAKFMRTVLALNTCKDMTRWRDAGYAASKEPPNTKEFGSALMLNLPAITVPLKLPMSEADNFEVLEAKANKRTMAVFTSIGDDWGVWAPGFGF